MGYITESEIYNIYPLGFCGAPKENDFKQEYRLDKIYGWIDHMKSMSVNALVFNPVFESSKHGYDTIDYKKIDCRLGGNESFKKICKTLHDNGIRIMLDGVFNHVGRDFFAFKDVRQNRENSRYASWFENVNFWNNSPYNDGFSYEGWAGYYDLVKLNLHNDEVVNYLLDCARFWIDEFDIDGLRLDVAYSLDHNFMRRLRSFCEEQKPGFVLIGEVLFGDYNLIVNDEMLHSCTNYECYKGIYSSLNSMNLFEIAHSLNRQYGPEQWCIYRGKHLMSFVDNHDVTRIASILTTPAHLPLAYGILFGMPGIPCIYYGSEWGEEGIKTPDNDYALRPCFEAPKPNALTDFIHRLITLRKNSDALCNGGYRNISITNHQLVFERRTGQERILIAINASESDFTIHHGELLGTFTDLLKSGSGNISQTLNGSLDLPAYSVQYLKEIS